MQRPCVVVFGSEFIWIPLMFLLSLHIPVSLQGVFPCSFIHLKEVVVEKRG